MINVCRSRNVYPGKWWLKELLQSLPPTLCRRSLFFDTLLSRGWLRRVLGIKHYAQEILEYEKNVASVQLYLIRRRRTGYRWRSRGVLRNVKTLGIRRYSIFRNAWAVSEIYTLRTLARKLRHLVPKETYACLSPLTRLFGKRKGEC
jgi:hypothetical protein